MSASDLIHFESTAKYYISSCQLYSLMSQHSLDRSHEILSGKFELWKEDINLNIDHLSLSNPYYHLSYKRVFPIPWCSFSGRL